LVWVALECLSIEKKKETFINMMIPSILLAKHKMKMERKKVLRLSNNSVLSQEENFWLSKKLEDFKVSSTDELYKNMELHPTSLIIAQAIVESGWGTSKFFQKANNVFGVWSFDKNEQRIVASEKRGKRFVYLKKYGTIHESIYDYLLTLSHVSHYESFREKRLETQDPFTLIEHLEKYSEQGNVYIANIKNIMKKNELLQYDNYELNL
jgi:Bax protein